MITVKLRLGLIFLAMATLGFLVLAPLAYAGQVKGATLQDLAWLEGRWAGKIGDQDLEEHWSAPKSGSLAAMVRLTSASGTEMVELVVIEPQDDTLMLHLQQWDAGYKPRAEGAQKFVLKTFGKRSATFTSVTSASFKEFTYVQPADGEFHIVVTPVQGDVFTIKLQTVS